jgi:hypothetical protein
MIMTVEEIDNEKSERERWWCLGYKAGRKDGSLDMDMREREAVIDLFERLLLLSVMPVEAMKEVNATIETLKGEEPSIRLVSSEEKNV